MDVYQRSSGSYVCELCATESERASLSSQDADNLRWDLAQETLDELRHSGDGHGIDFHAVLADTWVRCKSCDRIVH